MNGDRSRVLAIDANAIISALYGGRAADIIGLPRVIFLTTLRTTWEVERLIPRIAEDLARQGASVSEGKLRALFHSMPLTAFPDGDYQSHLSRAWELIGARDPKDVDILALALRFQVPVWTDDHHFDDLPEVEVVTTAELLFSLIP